LQQHDDIDLVLMDIMMPEMDGFTAIREIRARAQYEKLPIIALTAKAMPDDRQRCIEVGANDYITKPIDVDKLLSLVRIWLPSRRGALA
jgi:CheY-like chemotaxis protein